MIGVHRVGSAVICVSFIREKGILYSRLITLSSFVCLLSQFLRLLLQMGLEMFLLFWELALTFLTTPRVSLEGLWPLELCLV